MEVEIGKGKTGRKAYGFDEITIVPSRRTRDPEDIDISAQIDKYKLEIPCLASAMDGVVDVKMAILMGKLGGMAVLNLEGLQTRYENPDEQLEKIASFTKEEATKRMQEIYQESIKEELIEKRIKEIKAGGVPMIASLTPQKEEKYYKIAIEAGLDILVIQGTVVSAEHVSKSYSTGFKAIYIKLSYTCYCRRSCFLFNCTPFNEDRCGRNFSWCGTRAACTNDRFLE